MPSLETLEKLARALEVPLYRFFTDIIWPEPPELIDPRRPDLFGGNSEEQEELVLFAKALSKMSDKDRKMLMKLADRMASSELFS